MKRLLACVITITSLLISPAVIGIFAVGELFCSPTFLKLIYTLNQFFYKQFLVKLIPDYEELFGKPDKTAYINAAKNMREFFANGRKKYLDYCTTGIAYLQHLYTTLKKERFMISLDMDSRNPMYREIFTFLSHYFSTYRILPGKFLIDNFGLMHIKIQFASRIQDELSLVELASGLQMRLINSLADCEDLCCISRDYWNECTVYFPNLEKNLEQHQLVAVIALSASGAEKIQALVEADILAIHEDIHETL